ncbi:uncharacterized protein BO95DRAFT_463443 [Aspergillus brunneoviolaceus CBS 621.78]|uniref:Uncharacterized protein n=1 Tax=Aspergillus brunneoviolaceus CBS 621.78 TaxID=1450534 RepID=A0ACD1GA24_9EURO|nr:hypothetical protein BO95DRAFT_463443 [Aspergillus brunneoviolaceus CBS 621.78]RAH46103.1 hypothetical protein BO95DRAFT_463443 [Aspergillus brunneoviolaceus CBS 621.78]
MYQRQGCSQDDSSSTGSVDLKAVKPASLPDYPQEGALALAEERGCRCFLKSVLKGVSLPTRLEAPTRLETIEIMSYRDIPSWERPVSLRFHGLPPIYQSAGMVSNFGAQVAWNEQSHELNTLEK